MKVLLSATLLFAIQWVQAQEHTLKVKITGIKEIKGKIGVCLLTDESEFLGACSDFTEMAVTAKEMVFTKEGLASGSYVLTLYHDANNNGELDTNLLGLPKERYGFSNNPSTFFGPPSYSKCLFEVKEDTQVTVRLK